MDKWLRNSLTVVLLVICIITMHDAEAQEVVGILMIVWMFYLGSTAPKSL